MAVNVEANFFWLPFHGEDVKIIGNVAARENVRSTQRMRAGIARPMNSAVNGCRLGTDVFHDVDFPARRPPRRRDVIAEHPERGPQALPLRDANTRFKFSIL